jgi:glycolate oxidase FAD binding subunit
LPLSGGEANQGTVAGMFAANLAGARRIRVGAPRDHLLGVRGVNGRGEIFKSGGRVMKNVTGYDLCRGLAGSWGTLAVMSEVTFKVVPAPEDTAPRSCSACPTRRSRCCARRWRRSRGVGRRAPAAADRLAWHEGLWQRPGRSPRSDRELRQVGRLPTAAKEHFGLRRDPRLDRENSLAFWGELRQLSVLQGSDAPLWRISTAPSAGPKVVSAIAAYMESRAFYDWSGGLIWAEVLSTTDAGAADIRRVIATHGGHATLIRAEPDGAAVDVFQHSGGVGHSRASQGYVRSSRYLNPGRMYPNF